MHTDLKAEDWGRGADEKGAWSDDHIIPVAAFGRTEEDQLRCHNKKNRQPLGVSRSAESGTRVAPPPHVAPPSNPWPRVCHPRGQPSANARKGNNLYAVTLQQYEALRDHWPVGWGDVLLADVADKLKAPLRLCKPRDVLGPRFTELITCKKNTIEWRRSVCERFGLLPGVI